MLIGHHLLKTIGTSFQASYPKAGGVCCGFASVFPGTSTVESDFSLIGWEKDEYRFKLTDVSLEDILHAKQKYELAEIEKYLLADETVIVDLETRKAQLS